MPDPNPLILIPLQIILLAYLAWRLYSLFPAPNQIEDKIERHFTLHQLTVTWIGKLSVSELIRYRQSAIGPLRIYHYFYAMALWGSMTYLRKVEVEDEQGKTFTHFVDIKVANRKAQTIRRFDALEI